LEILFNLLVEKCKNLRIEIFGDKKWKTGAKNVVVV